MPSLSPTMTHGTISLWKASPGTELKAGDVLCEIETDKASVGFEMQENCVLAKILVEAHGPETAVGCPIALTVEDAAAYEAFAKADPSSYKHLEGNTSAPVPANSQPAQSATASTEASHAAPAASSGPQRFMPAARHMAESQGLVTTGVVGTAKGGRITKGDLLQGLKAGTVKAGAAKKHVAQTTTAAPTQAQATPASVAPSAPASSSAGPSQSAPVNEHYKDIPNSNMRKVIAKRLTESKATVPHFYTSIEVEIDKLMAFRKTMKKEFEQNLSVNDLVIKSAALALRDVPEANAKWNKTANAIDASTCRNVDISVAVATPSGLITPILTGADKRGLVDINSTVRDLATRARDGKLKPEEYQGGSFSISNLGTWCLHS
jgi:pyruvate dehydrogenase E2 component (dihydrolipoamide acetyltransferase)